MPLDQVHTAVEAYLRANWTATALAFENDGFQQPTNADTGEIIPYVMVEIYGGLYDQRSIGAGSAAADYWQDTGVVWLHVVIASGTGSLVAKQYGAQLAEMFRGLTLNPNISFGDITMGASGGSEDGNDWILSASIDWQQG